MVIRKKILKIPKAVNHIIEFKIYRIDNMERKIHRMIKFIERKYIELYNIERINIEWKNITIKKYRLINIEFLAYRIANWTNYVDLPIEILVLKLKICIGYK